MQSIIGYQERLRGLAWECAFADIEETYQEIEADWAASPPAFPDPYFDAVRSGALLDLPEYEGKDCNRFFRKWYDAVPESYRAALVWGNHLFAEALTLRTDRYAAGVAAERLLAARMACDSAAVLLLEAVDRHPRPVAACVTLVTMALHFGEPERLSRLFRQEPECDDRPDGDALLVRAATVLLEERGVPFFPDATRSRPAFLPERGAGEDAAFYWLKLGLSCGQGRFHLLYRYAEYLRPRWGYDSRALERFIESPMCRDLDPAFKNALAWLGVDDALDDKGFPEPDDSRGVQIMLALFEKWRARDLPPLTEALLLGEFACFCSYSLRDDVRARDLHLACCAAFPEPYYYDHPDSVFRDFAHTVIVKGLDDPAHGFRDIVERICRWDRMAAAFAVAGAGHMFGLWGFPEDNEKATDALIRAVMLEDCGETETDHYSRKDSFDIVAVIAMLWDSGAHAQACAMAESRAEYGHAPSMSFLSDLYGGHRSGAPSSLCDPDRALMWLERAAEAEFPIAMYNLGRALMEEAPQRSAERAFFEHVCGLFKGAWEKGAIPHARLHLGRLLRDWGAADERAEGVSRYLKPMAEEFFEESDPENWIVLRGYAETARAYLYGKGVPRNRKVAAAWIGELEKIAPDGDITYEIRTEFRQTEIPVVSWVIGLFTSVRPEDRPPIRT